MLVWQLSSLQVTEPAHIEADDHPEKERSDRELLLYLCRLRSQLGKPLPATMDGISVLLINDAYIEQVVGGSKTWEIRTMGTSKVGFPVGIGWKGLLYGETTIESARSHLKSAKQVGNYTQFLLAARRMRKLWCALSGMLLFMPGC